MSQVVVKKLPPSAAEPRSLFDEVKDLAERVRQRAYDLFRQRGSRDGFDLDDWLKAERDYIINPETDLVEKEGKFQVQAAIPGFDPQDVEVTATPEALIIRAASRHKHDEEKGDVHFCEFGERQLFRRIELPASVDVDKVTARLEKGLLHITAPKKTSALVKVEAAAA